MAAACQEKFTNTLKRNVCHLTYEYLKITSMLMSYAIKRKYKSKLVKKDRKWVDGLGGVNKKTGDG